MGIANRTEAAFESVLVNSLHTGRDEEIPRHSARSLPDRLHTNWVRVELARVDQIDG
jgi:hypothetical protein